MFQLYIGTDPLTGKVRKTTRRGFKTKKEAQLELARLQLEIDKGTYIRPPAETYREVYDLWTVQYENTVEESTFSKR
ncbi:MAG: Arm DNA-binding domain-containing protein [Solibacillus sp.]